MCIISKSPPCAQEGVLCFFQSAKWRPRGITKAEYFSACESYFLALRTKVGWLQPFPNPDIDAANHPTITSQSQPRRNRFPITIQPPETAKRTIPRLANTHDSTILRVEPKNDSDTAIQHSRFSVAVSRSSSFPKHPDPHPRRIDRLTRETRLHFRFHNQKFKIPRFAFARLATAIIQPPSKAN